MPLVFCSIGSTGVGLAAWDGSSSVRSSSPICCNTLYFLNLISRTGTLIIRNDDPAVVVAVLVAVAFASLMPLQQTEATKHRHTATAESVKQSAGLSAPELALSPLGYCASADAGLRR